MAERADDLRRQSPEILRARHRARTRGLSGPCRDLVLEVDDASHHLGLDRALVLGVLTREGRFGLAECAFPARPFASDLRAQGSIAPDGVHDDRDEGQRHHGVGDIERELVGQRVPRDRLDVRGNCIDHESAGEAQRSKHRDAQPRPGMSLGTQERVAREEWGDEQHLHGHDQPDARPQPVVEGRDLESDREGNGGDRRQDPRPHRQGVAAPQRGPPRAGPATRR